MKDGVNFQCQCEKKFKPDPDDSFKCLPGDKIIDETYCDEDRECFDEFPSSQCGIFACECMLGAHLNEGRTKCVKGKAADEQITMYEFESDFDKIWEFKRDEKDEGVSIWRAIIKKAEVDEEGVQIDDDVDADSFYNLGDILVKGTAKPKKGYLFKPVENLIPPFMLPINLEKVWSSQGMGVSSVSIWKPICPPKYVGVGLVASNEGKPKRGDIWCVRHYFTTSVKDTNKYLRKFIWSTDRTSAHLKVELSLRSSTESEFLSAQSFHVDRPVPSPANIPSSYIRDKYIVDEAFYFLENSKVFIWPKLPTKSIELTDVEFDLTRMTEELMPSVSVGKTTVKNWSKMRQVTNRNIQTTRVTGSSTKWTGKLEIGVKVSLKNAKASRENPKPKKLPGKLGKVEGGASGFLSFSDGNGNDNKQHDAMAAEINIPAHSKITVTATAQSWKMSVPFTATRHSLFYDGTRKVEKINAHANSIATDSMKVSYGPILPLTNDEIEDEAENESSDDSDVVKAAHEAILGADIIYNMQYPAERIWSTKSNHNFKGTFYRMRVKKPDCALGDTFVPEQEQYRGIENKIVTDFLGNNKSPVIRAIKEDVVRKPKDFSLIFSSHNLKIYQMIPYSDEYVCIGHIATNGVSISDAIKDQYCCVKKKYTVLAKPKWEWNFKGDRDQKGQVWRIERTMENTQFETFGINSGNFIFQPDTLNPSLQPTDEFRLLIGDDYNVKESKLIGFDTEKPLTLIQVDCHRILSDVEQMGSFLAVRKEKDISYPPWTESKAFNPEVFKPESREGYYPLGHYASWNMKDDRRWGYSWWSDRHWQVDSSIENRKGYLIGVADEDKVQDYVQHPDSYNLVYKTREDTFANGFAFWELDCPPGFVALGGVVTNGQLYPDYGSAYCVTKDIVEIAHATKQWGWQSKNYYKPGINVWISQTRNSDSIDIQKDFNQEFDEEKIAVNTLIPISTLNIDPNTKKPAEPHAYVLKRKEVNVLEDNPVRSTELTEMTFDWDRLEVPAPDPTKLKGVTVTNWSNTKQVVKRTLIHKVARTTKTTSEWGGYLKIAAGVKRSVAGFKGGASGHIKIEAHRATGLLCNFQLQKIFNLKDYFEISAYF